MRTLRLLAGLLLLVLAALQVSACTADRVAKPPPKPSMPAPVADSQAELAPVTLSDRPLWTHGKRAALSDVFEAEIRGDSVILTGEFQDQDRGLVVLDASTGAKRWSLSGLDELAGGRGAVLWLTDRMAQVVGDRDFSIVVPYLRTQPDPNEYGFAVLSGADGHVLRMSPVTPGVPESRMDDEDGEQVLQDGWRTDGRTVVARTGSTVVKTDEQDASTVAIDLTSGRVKWTRTGDAAVMPGAVVGDVLVGQLVAEGRPNTVVGLDLRTGRQRWTLAGRHSWSMFDVAELAAGDLLAVHVPGPRNPGHLAFLRASTGAELLSVGGVADCATDRRELIACKLYRETPDHDLDYRLLTVSADEPTALVSGNRVEATAAGIWQGRIFAGDERGTLGYDRAGNPLGGALPGEFEAMSDRYALLWTDHDRLAAYRRS